MDSENVTETELFPAFLDLRGRSALVVGGGSVAARKVRALLRSGADVRVVALAAGGDVAALGAEGSIRFENRAFAASDVAGCTLVFAATGVADVDAAIAQAARAAGALVNLADGHEGCDFLVPASGRRGAIQVAVGTAGTSPSLAVRLRDRFLAALGPEWERFAALLGEMRSSARSSDLTAAERQRVLAAAAADGDLLAAIARGERIDPDAALAREAAGGWSTGSPGRVARDTGFVSLVGAGPGSPELLTIAGRDLLQAADVVVYDDLVDRRMLAYARPDAELIYAGKRGWREGPQRPETGALLAEKAREGTGKRVVRLKGGDPMVFGRAGEEMATLEEAGVDFEVVPGVTAALAAAAGARIPLTLRGVSNSLTLATGNSATEAPAPATRLPGSGNLSGPPVARLASAVLVGGTLCIYMGLKGMGDICAALVERGVDEELPVAVVEGAYSESQRSVFGTLATITDVVATAAIASPAMVIVGAVVGHSVHRHTEDPS